MLIIKCLTYCVTYLVSRDGSQNWSHRPLSCWHYSFLHSYFTVFCGIIIIYAHAGALSENHAKSSCSFQRVAQLFLLSFRGLCSPAFHEFSSLVLLSSLFSLLLYTMAARYVPLPHTQILGNRKLCGSSFLVLLQSHQCQPLPSLNLQIDLLQNYVST